MQILNYKLEAYVPFDEESIEKFLVHCEDAIDRISSDEKTKFKLKSAIHELLVNSLEHGYSKTAGKVSVSIRKERSSIYFEICDEGCGVDLSKINLNRKIQDLDVATGRGWGLLIINRFADSMEIVPNTPRGTRVCLTINE